MTRLEYPNLPKNHSRIKVHRYRGTCHMSPYLVNHVPPTGSMRRIMSPYIWVRAQRGPTVCARLIRRIRWKIANRFPF